MEENSPDWKQIAADFVNKTFSNRELARRYGVSEGAIRKRAKKENWCVPAAEEWERVPERVPPKATFGHDDAPPLIPAEDEVTRKAAADVGSLVERGRELILQLMAELKLVNDNVHLLEEIVEIEHGGEKNPRHRLALLRALSLPVRSQAAKNLATALSTLKEVGPGKKEEAEKRAKTAEQGTSWEDDLNEDHQAAGRPN